MLTELRISNFAIIDHQSISFGAGLNVISGETGAGKSIILHALELILGARPRAQAIRSGADALSVEAVFDLSQIPESVRAELPDIARADELLISRSMNIEGRGKVYINGRLATVGLLAEIGAKIMNICGQTHSIKVLDALYHLELVDDYLASPQLLSEYQVAYQGWQQVHEQVRDLEQRHAQNSLLRADLEEQIAELSPLKPRAGLRQELEARLKRSAGAELILSTGQVIDECFNGEQGMLAQLQTISAKMQELSKVDSGLSALYNLFQSARTELKEFQADFDNYISKVSVDESELEKLRDKIAEVARLERKYRTDSAGLEEFLVRAEGQRRELSDESVLPKLKNEEASLRQKLKASADKLSSKREDAGKKIVSAVKKELGELNMPDAGLKFQNNRAEPGPRGQDMVEFLISTNKGEPFKQLRQIASGGELSRLTLILKNVLRERTGVNVLVFDEVDTGVSGKVARAVGEKLKALAKGSQVLCITHLAQVASLADHHFLVSKKVGSRAVSVVEEISDSDRVEEVARMLAGYEVTAAARKSARELLASHRVAAVVRKTKTTV